jgi:hypothetical protein
VSNPFSRAVDACFEHLGVAAVYTPDGGAPLDIRAVARRPDEIVGFGDTRIHAETAVFDVRVSEVGIPRPGDRLTVEGVAYVIQGEPVRDPERLVWTLETYPA